MDSAGIPLPAAVDVLVVAVAAANPQMAGAAALMAVVGSVIGCMLLFYAARKGGQFYLEQKTQSGRARKFRLWFVRYGLVTVFVPTLLPFPPLPTKIFVISAGALGTSPSWFLLTVVAARLIRYLGLAWLGAQLREHSLTWLGAHGWHLVAAGVVLSGCLVWLLKFAEGFGKPPRGLG